MRSVFCVILAAAATCVCATAHAGCEKDTDCKGDRVCVSGECTAPTQLMVAPAPVYVPPPPAPFAAPAKHVRAGWSRGAGITGLVFAPVALGFFAGAAAILSHENGSLTGGAELVGALLGGVGGILHILGGSLAGGGANSARGVDHVLGCVISGWVLYGLTIVYTALEFAIGSGLERSAPPAVVVGIGGAMSFVSIVLLSIDGLVVASRAHEILDSAQAERESPRLSLYPVLAPVRNGSQTVGLSGGLGLVF